jgi:hypothetical protein
VFASRAVTSAGGARNENDRGARQPSTRSSSQTVRTTPRRTDLVRRYWRPFAITSAYGTILAGPYGARVIFHRLVSADVVLGDWRRIRVSRDRAHGYRNTTEAKVVHGISAAG